MKREELERWTVKKWVHSEWEIVTDERGEFFWVEDVNPVLDTMEQRIKELEAENARLKAQVPKWHSGNFADGDLPTRSDMYCVLFHTEDGRLIRSACYYFADEDGDSCFGEWEFDDVEKWCELPPAEESSATEKENG